MNTPDRLEAFVVTAPGLEGLAHDELRALGIQPNLAEPGGVTFHATARDLYAANLWLRTASRVVVRLASFQARAFSELERHARRQPWDTFIRQRGGVKLRVTCRKSRLYHSDAVAERVAEAVDARTGSKPRFAKDDDSETQDHPHDEQLVIVRLLHDRCTISVDSSGDHLHMRGYRQALAKAPLRETLAAASLLATGWRGTAPLLDPMCGSGTIAIEGAMIARRLPPGRRRRFAFERWPVFERPAWEALLEEADSRALSEAPVPIQASDRDAGAVEAATGNAMRAGVGADVEVLRRPISAVSPAGPAGWLTTNPPYGVRVGDRERLRDLYAQLGNVARARFVGWRIGLISADRSLECQLGLPLRTVVRTTNGGIPVRIVSASIEGDRSRPDRV